MIDQNWVKTADGSHPERFQYGYDRSGDKLYQANLVNTSQSELYHANSATSGDSNTAYDPMGRLASFARGTLSSSGRNGTQPDTIASPSHSQSYSLDALGDFSGVTTDGTTASRTFNAQDQATSASGGGSAAPTFDADGNTTGTGHGAYQMNVGGTVAYVYDAWDRLVAVKNGPGTSSPGYPIGSYAYDALGRRIGETNAQNANLSSHLYYSAAWQVIEERSGVNTPSSVTWQYVWGAAYVDGLVLRDSYSGGTQNARLYALTDAQYDVTSVVNASGVVQERYEYDPYGSVTYLDASWASRSGSTLSWQYLHQGGRLDAMTGWYGFRNRDLIPGEMRWAERDPLGLGAGDLDIYRYVGNSPATYVDPAGLGLSSASEDMQGGPRPGQRAPGLAAPLGDGSWSWGDLGRNLGIGTTLSHLGGTLSELPGAYISTALSGEQFDSYLGWTAGIYDHFVGGPLSGITGKDWTSGAEPWFGNEEAFRNGHKIGDGTGYAMDLAMAIFGMRGAPTGLPLPSSLTLSFGGMSPALAGGGLLPMAGGVVIPLVRPLCTGIGVYGILNGGYNFSELMSQISDEGTEDAPKAGLPSKVQVKGDWGSDPVHNVEVRTGLYDADTGQLHVGGLEGHRSVARGAGIGDKPGTNISGLEIVKRGDGISFRDRSGWYPRALTPEEQANIAKALEAEFGMPAKYAPDLGTVLRPGAPK